MQAVIHLNDAPVRLRSASGDNAGLKPVQGAWARAPPLQSVRLEDGLTLAYRELGDGPAVLLLHGWPTSSFLWRK